VVGTLYGLEPYERAAWDVFRLDWSKILGSRPSALLVRERGRRMMRRRGSSNRVRLDSSGYSSEENTEGRERVVVLCDVHSVDRVEDDLTKGLSGSDCGSLLFEKSAQCLSTERAEVKQETSVQEKLISVGYLETVDGE
jgi:hypothetical protein